MPEKDTLYLEDTFFTLIFVRVVALSTIVLHITYQLPRNTEPIHSAPEVIGRINVTLILIKRHW